MPKKKSKVPEPSKPTFAEEMAADSKNELRLVLSESEVALMLNRLGSMTFNNSPEVRETALGLLEKLEVKSQP